MTYLDSTTPTGIATTSCPTMFDVIRTRRQSSAHSCSTSGDGRRVVTVEIEPAGEIGAGKGLRIRQEWGIVVEVKRRWRVVA